MKADENKLGEAIDFFSKAAAINWESAELWFEMGKVQYRSRRFSGCR